MGRYLIDGHKLLAKLKTQERDMEGEFNNKKKIYDEIIFSITDLKYILLQMMMKFFVFIKVYLPSVNKHFTNLEIFN